MFNSNECSVGHLFSEVLPEFSKVFLFSFSLEEGIFSWRENHLIILGGRSHSSCKSGLAPSTEVMVCSAVWVHKSWKVLDFHIYVRSHVITYMEVKTMWVALECPCSTLLFVWLITSEHVGTKHRLDNCQRESWRVSMLEKPKEIDRQVTGWWRLQQVD